MKELQIVPLDSPPYSTTDALSRFSADKTVFARMRSDPEFRTRVQSGVSRQLGPVESALKGSAWSVLGDLSERAYERDRDDGLGALRHEPENCFTSDLKKTAHTFGSGATGIARVNRLWLYAPPGEEIVPEHLDTAITMVIPMDRGAIAQSPSAAADAATGNGYARMAFVTSCMVDFVHRLGWSAVGCGNDTALSVPLAIDSGLGECGRNGILTTPTWGSCVRICKIFTDMPLVPDRPISFGMPERCDSCRRCVKACPVGAISDTGPTSTGLGQSSNPGVVKWFVDGEKCRHFWRNSADPP